MRSKMAAAAALATAVMTVGIAKADQPGVLLGVGGNALVLAPGVWEPADTEVGVQFGVVGAHGTAGYLHLGLSWGVDGPEKDFVAPNVNGGILTLDRSLRLGVLLQYRDYAHGENGGAVLAEIGPSIAMPGGFLHLEPSVFMGPCFGRETGFSTGLGLAFEFRGGH